MTARRQSWRPPASASPRRVSQGRQAAPQFIPHQTLQWKGLYRGYPSSARWRFKRRTNRPSRRCVYAGSSGYDYMQIQRLRAVVLRTVSRSVMVCAA
jgi:hypothetical protein